MALTTDEMIDALNAVEADTGCEENQARLYKIIAGFRELADRERLIPVMFALMERFPDAFLGTPGPLVHSIESRSVPLHPKAPTRVTELARRFLEHQAKRGGSQCTAGPDERER